MLRCLGIAVENVRVQHCYEAYGVSITSIASRGWKIVYSGDTRPSSRLAELGRFATVVIHEATFDDSKIEDAVEKNHSTVSEAVQTAEQMNASRLLLTHYSQRYATLPPIPYSSPSATDALRSLGILPAFDFMSISFADMVWAPLALDALKLAFPPEFEDDDDDVPVEVKGSTAAVSSDSVPAHAIPLIRSSTVAVATTMGRSRDPQALGTYCMESESSMAAPDSADSSPGRKRKLSSPK